MANYKFSSDLVNDILFRAGEPTDGTSNFEATALQYLNRAYRTVWLGGGEFLDGNNQNWWWLRKDPPGTLTLQPSISAGTVNVTSNSTSITFSSAPSASVTGYFFRVTGQEDVFRILTHTGGSASATLDSVYTGTTSTTASYKLMKMEYDLASDVFRVIAPMRVRFSERGEVEGIDLKSMDHAWPIHLAEAGVPELFAHVGERKIRFNRFGSDDGALMRVEYDYLYIPADLTDSGSEEPLVPLAYRYILSDIAAGLLFIDKNDDRATLAIAAAKAGLQAMINENKKRWLAQSNRYGRIRTRQDQLEQFNRTLRTETGFIIG